MNTPNLNQALVRAQAKFGPIKRTLTGKVQSDKAKYEYDYAPLDAVLDACRGPLTDNGLSWTMEFVEDDLPRPADLTQTLVESAMARLDAKTQDGAAYTHGVTALIEKLREHMREREASSRFCRLRLKTTLRHISGEEISTSLPLLFGKAWPNMQDLGSASTYAARYTFCRLVGVHAESDDDAMHAANIQGQYQREPRGDRRQQQQQGRRPDQQRPQQPQGQAQQRPPAPQQPDQPQQQPAQEPPPPAPPAEQPQQPAAEPPAQPQLTNGLGEPVDWPVPDRKLEPGEWEKFSQPQQIAYARSRVAKHVGDMAWLNKYTDWVRTHSTWTDAEFNNLLHYAAELSLAQDAQTQPQ